MAERLIGVRRTALRRRSPELQIMLVASPRNQPFFLINIARTTLAFGPRV